jgi:UDP-GlcNAc3NAcA epimerase
MKIVSVVGARPQFIKAAAISPLLRDRFTEILVHTGQHYDENMSEVFFRELGLQEPEINLGIGSGKHGEQTAAMLAGLEKVFLSEKPDCVMVYGDTNSTLAGALAAAKLHIPVAHVEAGVRSYNRLMPEEINRLLTDHAANILFCPGKTAIENLEKEGIRQGVYLVGDVMADTLRLTSQRAVSQSRILKCLGLHEKGYLLLTVHRAENTDNISRLTGIFSALESLNETVIVPLHPRTRKTMEQAGITLSNPKVKLIEPLGYIDMIRLEQTARMILTDSGGVQKEAYWLGVPCITLRDETEWVETVSAGWNLIGGTEPEHILEAVRTFQPSSAHPVLYGDGFAAQRCVDILSAEVQ